MLINESDLFRFFDFCVQNKIDEIGDVILPAVNQFGTAGETSFKRYSENGEFVLDTYRTIDPAKIVYYHTREQILPELSKAKLFILAGVKNCDLRAIQFLDRALMNEDFVDPNYKHWREQAILISSDCNEIYETCHCNLMEGKPFSVTGFDVNLSRVGDAYVATSDSKKGEALLKLIQENVPVASPSDAILEQVVSQRTHVVDRLEEQNKPYQRNNLYGNLVVSKEGFWEEESVTCIGCGACTHICPTCYCLILNDESDAEKFIKVRSYDSCQYHGYARVAGGGSPRPQMHQRFRNRYLCKFIYTKSNFDLYGCTGCGRCTETCPGNIDFRKVVQHGIQSPAEQSSTVDAN